MDRFIDTRDLVSFCVSFPVFDEAKLVKLYSVGVTATTYRMGTKIMKYQELPDRSKHGKVEMFDGKTEEKEVECVFEKGKLHGKYVLFSFGYDLSEFDFENGVIQRATFTNSSLSIVWYIRSHTYKKGRILESDSRYTTKRYIRTKDGRTLRVKKVFSNEGVFIEECFASNSSKKYLNVPFFEIKKQVFGKKGIVNQRTFTKE
ncbi:hypothetical protein PMV_066 [Port-miou virus]|uniref:Uncharacterized protein n=1 Tax=Port-miou virus TaxID=1733873 RepID=A0A0N9PU78_9VIRU|nr:hypothetical protein PMV_066 [Port-miou virus]